MMPTRSKARCDHPGGPTQAGARYQQAVGRCRSLEWGHEGQGRWGGQKRSSDERVWNKKPSETLRENHKIKGAFSRETPYVSTPYEIALSVYELRESPGFRCPGFRHRCMPAEACHGYAILDRKLSSDRKRHSQSTL